MGQFPSSPEGSSQAQSDSIFVFSRPSFLRPLFQQQLQNKHIWLEDNDRKDFESFVQHIFSYQSSDGSLNLPENYSQSTFDTLIQSLMKQLDKYLKFQPVFDKIDKAVLPYIDSSFTPEKLIPPINNGAEKTQPFIDFVLQLYNDLVLAKPTPENIDIFLNLFSQFSLKTEVYSPLMTSLLPHITTILLFDNEASQKLCNILIAQLNNQYSSVYYVMALVDAILQMPSLAMTIALNPKIITLEFQNFDKPTNQNITMMRTRLGENAIVKTACHYQQQSYILRNDNALYKVSTNSVKLVKLDTIKSPTRIAVNRRYLFVFLQSSIIHVYETRNHMSKKESINFTTPENHELAAVCTYGEKDLFMLFHENDTNNYVVEYLNSSQIRVGCLKFKKPPICMSVENELLLIATSTKLYNFEIDFDNFKLAPMLPIVLNIPKGWKLLSMQDAVFLAMKPARSHLQLAYLQMLSPLSFLPRCTPPELPEMNGTILPKTVIHILIANLVIQLSGIVWKMVLESSPPNVSAFIYDDNFIPFLVDIVKKSVNSLETTTLNLVVFAVLALILIHFNDEHKLSESIVEKIQEMLLLIAKSQQIIMKTDILLTLFLIFNNGFENVFANSPEKLIEISKLICSSQQTKEQFALFLPVLTASPSILYLIDGEILKILYENTSPYTTCYVVKNSFSMLIAEYMRLRSKNMDTSQLIFALKVLTEAGREYFPKEIVLAQFAFFLNSLNEKKLTSLIVAFFEFLKPTIEYFDRKFQPDKVMSTGISDDDMITEQTIETKHPVGNGNKYCWDIVFPGAVAMEVEFDPSCSILIDDQDIFQILGGCSATSPVVYEKEPKSAEPFPRKLLINSSSARVIFRSFAGYHLHGLKIVFRRVNSTTKECDHIIDSFQFYTYYFFHILGNCISTVFQDKVENPKMNCCQFMLWMKKIELPNSLNKSQARMVPKNFMDMMAYELKTVQRIKATPEIQEIETLCASAALNQLEFTETVLNSKKFEEPSSLHASTMKMSALMMPRVPVPSNNKRPPRPAIIVPTNTLNYTTLNGINNLNSLSNFSGMSHANTMTRQSLMTPKERSTPISQNSPSMNSNEKINSFLKVLWKLIYQMRTRIHFAKQKSQEHYQTQLATIRDKAIYFATIRSVFEPVNNSDSLDVLTSRATQILRVISADFTLNEMFTFVNDNIEFQSNQAGMIKQLERFAHHITHQHLLMQIFYPLCKRLMGASKISIPSSTAAAFKVLFHNLSKHFMHVDSQPDNSFQLMTLLSNFALVGFNESQGDAVFAAIKGFIDHNQNTVAWQLFLHFCMNVSSQLFENKAKYFFESGIVSPTLLLQTLLILSKGNRVTNLSFVSEFINSKQPHMIRSVFLFLSAYFAKTGVQEEFSVKIKFQTMEAELFFKYLLKIIGKKASGKHLSLLPKEMAAECQSMVYSEIVSFFRICIKKTSRVHEFLIRLFDTILLEYSKTFLNQNNSKSSDKDIAINQYQAIGVFVVLGEGFFSIKANGYALHDKAFSVMKIEELSLFLSKVSLKSLTTESIIQIDKKRIIGYPRIPPSPDDYPVTKFRANVILTILNNYQQANKVLFCAFSLYLNVALQNENSMKMIISLASEVNFINTLLKISNRPSYEGQYHSMTELIEAAAQYDMKQNSIDKNNQIDRLLKLNSYAKVGNNLTDKNYFYYEFSLLEDLKKTSIMIGFISDDSCSEYHSFVALDLQKKMIVVNGIVMRGTELTFNFNDTSVIGCLFDNYSVSFIFNNSIIPFTLPFKCRRYTPLIISSNTEIKYKVSFSNFTYSPPKPHSSYEIIDLNYNIKDNSLDLNSNNNSKNNSKKNSDAPSNITNSLDDDSYASYLRQSFGIQNAKGNKSLEGKLTIVSEKFLKPFFAGYKEIFESKTEVSSYLKNIKGQPFIINSKLDPFDKNIGYLSKIGKDGKFSLNILDTEIGQYHNASFDESFLERINFHYFPMKPSYDIFYILSIRSIRYITLFVLNTYEKILSKLDDNLIAHFLSKMICELIPYRRKYKLSLPYKNKEAAFASTISFVSLIFLSRFRNFLLNLMNSVIKRESIIDQLYNILKTKITRINSPKYSINEFNFIVETTHPMIYTRIDRVIKSSEATHFLIIPDPLFKLENRGVLLKGAVNPFLVRKASDIESMVAGSSLYINLSNNKPGLLFGAKLFIIPQFTFATDSTYMPISWIIHFGTALLDITANRYLPKLASDSIIPILLNNKNQILKLFRFQLLSPILFSTQPLNNEKLYEMCLPLLMKFKEQFSILSTSSQEDAILLVASYIRLHTQKFKEIEKVYKTASQPTPRINATNISSSLHISMFMHLMKSGQDFLNTLGHKRLEFIAYLIPFLNSETLFPYFLFYNHYFSSIKNKVVIETPDHPTTSNYTFHLKFDGSPHQRVEISKDSKLSKDVFIRIFSPKDPSLNFDINNNDERNMNFPIHSDDFFIQVHISEELLQKIKNNPSQTNSITSNSISSTNSNANINFDSNDNTIITENSSSSTYGIKMIIDPLTDNTNFQPQIVASNLPKFLEQIKQMNSLWKPAHDVLLTPYLKNSNIFSVLSTTSQILLNKFPEDLIKCRFSFIKRLNELFNGEAGQLLLNDASQPLVSLIIQASSAFSSAMKLSRLEKIICKNFCQKKTFSFNRSRALLAKTHPESPEAKSLFEQVIDQIPINSLNSLKCKDAPWRVTLEGEGATDVGGPGRDLFTEVSSELCMPHNHIFIKTPRSIADPSIEEYIPDPRCTKVNKFVYAGAFIALAFVTRLQQPYKFADLIWSFLAGRKVTIEHIIEIDPSFGVTLSAASKGTLTDLHYTVKNIFGEEVELIPGGATIFVHPNDLKQYCQLASTFRRTEFDAQLKKMREGFSIFLGDICPQLVTPEELKSYICGSVDIPIQELRQLIQTSNATPAEEEMLYEVLEMFTVEERMLFIKFVTGKMSVPAPGASWNGSLNVEFVKLKPKKPPYLLPLAATCSSTVSIPRYPTKEILYEKLKTAITYGSDIVLDHAFDAGGIIE